MKSPRRRSREFGLQAIYQWQLAQQSTHELEQQYRLAEGFDKADAELFKILIAGVVQNADTLSVAMSPYLDRAWAEVSPVERAVLLIAGYELSRMPETPYRVIINEAIELAKSFGGTDGHKYVNGVLDKFAAITRADEIAAPPLAKRPTAKRPTAKRR
ncbi:MAG: transcription antitermination factor NusB [Rhodocyclaceae bacterium]|nr:transcription antitermination factor NusB [Rhodocyclaceae bacterium]